jgi:ribulose-5-phosphate 4-epimerase/fuculose-1-phosphate aldolase
MTDAMRKTRVDLAAAHRMAVFDGLNEGTWNHFSATVPDWPDCMLVSPEFCHWTMVTASNLVRTDSNGNPIGGSGAGRIDSSGYCIHYPIHASRPDVACVLHAHPPYATAIALSRRGRFVMAEQGALTLYNRVAYYDYDGFVFTTDHGKRLADALADKRVLFLRGHGVIVVGPSIAEAYTDLYQLERACAVQCHARALGEEIETIPDAMASACVEQDEYASAYKLAHFEAMKRLMDVEQPGYLI